MFTGLLIISAMFLVLAGTGPLMVLGFHRFVSHRYRIPGILELALQMMGRSDDEPTSVDVVMKRIRRQIPGHSIKSLDPGIKFMYRIHVLMLALPDYDLVSSTVGLRQFSQHYADFYAGTAMKHGWHGDLSLPLEVYVLPDAGVMSNHPRLSGTKAPSNHQPFMVVPLLPESFSSSHARSGDERSEAPGPTRVSVGPAATLPYGPEMTAATRSEAGAAQHVPPGSNPAAIDADSGAGEWMRDLPAPPALWREGRLIARLEGTIRVGRGSECEVFLKDATVSRSHAQLRVSHGVWVLVPEEGKNSYVNRELVSAITPLVDGDVLSFAASPELLEFRA
ncbi:FHA domain-containing protein [Pseudarthrobacter sp. fls2-241-R2A-127]|uniref:FHA domain-containing protein n=1 Tax=Pseudarthrobacter sp. fls2-241-R2A-127 TaxID=3040303 RepID=UPI00255253B7|nr:FHA domain-containing protein [Pseudarthrobacter sp. fls2-241-R2A-127]